VRADTVEDSLTSKLDRPVVSFNMASNGAGPLTQLIHVQRLLRRGVRPDLLVIELSPLSYDYADAPSDLARFPADRLERGDLGIVQQFCGKESLRKEWWETFFIPIHGHRLTILNQVAEIFVPYPDRLDLWTDTDAYGYRPPPNLPTPGRHAELLKYLREQAPSRYGNFKSGQPRLRA